MKRKIKIPTYVSQALGSNINKQVEVSTSVIKKEKKIENFNSYEPSLGL
jgi:hypothetical protein